MVDAPWLSPRELLWGIFYFLGIGHWGLVILSPPAQEQLPHPPLSPFPLGVGTTSGKGRLSK